MDIVFKLQPSSIGGRTLDKVIVNAENLNNIGYQCGRIYRSLDTEEINLIAVVFIEFNTPLEIMDLNSYELNKKGKKTDGCIEILYTKSCLFENKSFITACSIAIHGIKETENSSYRIQFLPSK